MDKLPIAPQNHNQRNQPQQQNQQRRLDGGEPRARGDESRSPVGNVAARAIGWLWKTSPVENLACAGDRLTI